MHNRSAPVAVAAAVALLLLGACSSTPPAPSHTGALRMAFTESDSFSDPLPGWFSDEVYKASAGKLAVTVVGGCCGEGADNETDVVKGVASAAYDLGWVPTRVFDTVGVTSVQALTAPMLIDSYATQKGVLASGVPAKMLSGLSKAKVTGLAIEPGILRKPISATGPLRAPADWKGSTFFVVKSNLNAATITALGATPNQDGTGSRDDGFTNGSIQGYENSVAFQSTSDMPARPVITANVNLWPRMSALIANPALLKSLTAAERSAIRQAAATVSKRVDDLAAIDADAVETACTGQGAKFVIASAADLAAMTTALQPVYTALERDPVTTSYIDAILAVKKTAGADPPLTIPADCLLR